MLKSRIGTICWAPIIVLAAILGGCNSFGSVPDNLRDQSILTDKPCKAPCWYNLTPGVSSMQEALDTLANLAFIDSASIHTQDEEEWEATSQEFMPAIRIRANCKQPTETACVEIIVLEDVVKYISIFPNYRLTVDEVVDHVGEPDYIETSPWGVECLGCVMELMWLQPSTEILLTHIDTRCIAGSKVCQDIEDGGKLPLGLEVEMITYMVPSPRRGADVAPWPGFAEP